MSGIAACFYTSDIGYGTAGCAGRGGGVGGGGGVGSGEEDQALLVHDPSTAAAVATAAYEVHPELADRMRQGIASGPPDRCPGPPYSAIAAAVAKQLSRFSFGCRRAPKRGTVVVRRLTLLPRRRRSAARGGAGSGS